MKRLTYKNNLGQSYLEYGADAVWSKCEAYDVLKNAISKLAEYEDIGATPDELKTAVYLYLELSQKMRRIIKDMRYYLDANEEDGVVYIPKFVIEEIAYGR